MIYLGYKSLLVFHFKNIKIFANKNLRTQSVELVKKYSSAACIEYLLTILSIEDYLNL